MGDVRKHNTLFFEHNPTDPNEDVFTFLSRLWEYSTLQTLLILPKEGMDDWFSCRQVEWFSFECRK